MQELVAMLQLQGLLLPLSQQRNRRMRRSRTL